MLVQMRVPAPTPTPMTVVKLRAVSLGGTRTQQHKLRKKKRMQHANRVRLARLVEANHQKQPQVSTSQASD